MPKKKVAEKNAPPLRWGNPDGDPEKLDPTPMAIPMGFQQPPPLQELIAKMVQTAVQMEKGEEFETMQESDDFEEEDSDLLDLSPYEFQNIQEDFDPASQPLYDQFKENQPLQKTGDDPDPNDQEPESHRPEIIPQDPPPPDLPQEK